MIYNAFKSNDPSKLIHEYFELSFSEKLIPYETTILPITMPAITYIKKGMHKIVSKKEEFHIQGIILSGQTFSTYQLKVDEKSSSCGMVLHPTAVYKIFGKDVSNIKDKHLPLEHFCNNGCFEAIKKAFNSKTTKYEALDELENSIAGFAINKNKHTDIIDKTIDFIKEKEGLLHVQDLLNIVPISQKTLETKFKQIVGETPGKYIKLCRFINLMRKYECDEIKIKDLIFMYNYYDESHFAKDFKLFTGELPKEYFKKEHDFIKKYLKE